MLGTLSALFIMYVFVNGEVYDTFQMQVPDMETCKNIGDTFPRFPIEEMEIVIQCASKEISA